MVIYLVINIYKHKLIKINKYHDILQDIRQ